MDDCEQRQQKDNNSTSRKLLKPPVAGDISPNAFVLTIHEYKKRMMSNFQFES